MKYTFDVKENINLFQIKQLLIFLIGIVQKNINLEIDDTVSKIPDSIKNQFKIIK